MTVEGRPGLVIDRVEGSDLLTRLGADPRLLDRVAAAMARVHAAMHEVRAPDSLPALEEELAARIEQAEPLPDDLRRAALDVLATLPRGDRLCHGDLHPGNLLGPVDEPVVIDWGNAARGDPVADVVRSALLLRMGEPPPGTAPALRVLARVGGGLASVRYVHHYRRARPIDTTQFRHWRIVRVAARLAEPIPEERRRLLALLRRDLRGSARRPR